MKKYLYSALALMGMLFMNSCSQDDLVPEPNNGDFVNASFTIGTTEGIGTRAVGLAENVDQVTCAVFDANNDEMTDLRQNLEVKGGKATYEVRLAKGQNYRVAFFAYDKDANAYDVTDMKSIKVLGNQASNMDNRDAFTAYTDINAADLTSLSNIDREVRLYRPFAQLNLGVDDAELEAARKAGIVVTNTQITVSNVYNAFSAFDNAVAADATPCEMTFALNGIPQEKLVVEGANYNYLALNYLLVGDVDTEKSLADVEFVWATADGKTNTPATNFINIPVQRNYRTNIIGKLLTTPTEYNIVVDNHFCGEKVVHKVFNTLDLQAALDAASDGETVLYLADDITGDVVEQQKADRNIVIDGQGYKWNGTIKIHNGSNYNTGTFTVKNVNFETSDNKRNFIEALENGSERYSNNVTIENCTFKSPATRSENDVVGVQVKNSKNLQVLNCTATGIHSLLQAQSCGENVEVKGCTINGKNGVAFKQVKNAVVEGCEITATAYGIRFDGNVDNYGITVRDNEVTAVQPLIVRKMTGKDNTITLDDKNTLIANATPAYQIVITNGSDDEEYVKPTGSYTLTGADGYYMFPELPVAKVGNTEYTSIDAAIAAWTHNTTLTLLKNVTLKDVVTLKSTEYRVLDLGIYTMTAAKGKDAISITAEGRSSASYALDIKADATNPGGITATSKAVVKTTGKSGVKDRPIIRFYNGVFNASNIISHSGSNGTNCPQFQFHGGVYNGSLTANRALIQIYGGTFNGRFYISVDSSAYALISGGKFKYLDNLYGSALNSDKFTIGSSKGNFDRGVYVDDEGYIVVGGSVITDFGDKFAAKATNVSKAGTYLPYSSAAEYGLYYTNAAAAIAKHGEGNVVLP